MILLLLMILMDCITVKTVANVNFELHVFYRLGLK